MFETQPSRVAPKLALSAHTDSARVEKRRYAGPERRGGKAPLTRWLTLMLDEMDHGLMLVNAAGELRHANQLARHELARGDGMLLAQGRVQSNRSDEQTVLTQALVDAARGRRCLLTLGQEGSALSVAVVPMAAEPGDSEPLTLLMLGKRRSCETLTVDFFARTQGLTGAEANVLQALCSGMRPKEVARQFGVAVSTVRSQISSIRTKTQTASIQDLVNRVSVLPPITPVMKSALAH
ncbi:MAG TPA: LuxR C-terminal-related transcriptional regulator [Rhizobacter sp.]|nr:LuxR C-terminal-related transcriptional regulator [Rhizobacter sp.]